MNADSQATHTHSARSAHHLPVHGRGGPDGGAMMMAHMALLSNALNVHKYTADYRTRRLVPISNALIIGSLLALAAGAALWAFLPESIRWIGTAAAIVTGAWALILFGGGLALTHLMRGVRQSARRTLIGSIDWKGTESVLDVGCGSGMTLNGAALKLTSGKATGIDMWEQEVSGQSADLLMRNARAEGVADKVAYQKMDARQLTFKDRSFDVALSSFALHHIGGREDIEQAIAEISRVLKPGGAVSLLDIGPMIDIAEPALRSAGLDVTGRVETNAFYMVTARKG